MKENKVIYPNIVMPVSKKRTLILEDLDRPVPVRYCKGRMSLFSPRSEYRHTGTGTLYRYGT